MFIFCEIFGLGKDDNFFDELFVWISFCVFKVWISRLYFIGLISDRNWMVFFLYVFCVVYFFGYI